MRKLPLALLVAACALLIGAPPAAWRILGPGGGGAMFLPTISPHDPNHVFLACDMTGGYVTRDGGRSWRMFNLRGRVDFFAFDPKRPAVAYAYSIGLFRTDDYGASWRLVYPDPRRVTGVHLADDHAGGDILTHDGAGPNLTALAVDPDDSGKLYAVAAARGSQASLLVSIDAGASWRNAGDVPPGPHKIFIQPGSAGGMLYVIGKNSVALRNAGAAWKRQPPPAGVDAFLATAAGFPKSGGPLVVYGITERDIHLSRDGGASWRKIAAPDGSPKLRTIATSLHHPEVAYLSYNGLRSMFRTWLGVARTADYGAHWTLAWTAASRHASNVEGGWISESYGPGWADNPLGIGVGPNHPDVCFTTDYGRAVRSTDGGRTWEGVYSRKTADGGFLTNGLDVTTAYGVHFDPFDARRLFISFTDIGLFRSENGGASWLHTLAGIPRAWQNTTYWLEFDPAVRGRVWGVMSGVHDLPRPKMWRGQSTDSYRGGVCRSDDGGQSWQPSNAGLPEGAATHVLLDANSPPQARVLYTTLFGRGVFKSADGGRTWQAKNRGIQGATPFAWRLVRDAAGALYLIVARRTEDGSFGNAGDGGLYRSTDGAESWTRLPLPPGVNGPNGLAIDARDPARLYLAAWARDSGAHGAGGGVFLSTDAGKSWRNVLARDQHIYDVTSDSRTGALYAAGFESSAWRSADRGRTWRRIRGYNFKWGHRVIPDPADPARVYVTTFGGSVWNGPAEGDPLAPEDIAAPPALRYSPAK